MTSKIRIGLSIVFVLLYCLLSCLPTSYLSVYASSIQVDGGYTSVLEDLSTDEGFDPDNYPIKEDDYSLQVIQIAESSDKELFVYVYQPCSPNFDLKATCINMSLEKNDSTSNQLYYLTLLNSDGVFHKYIVNNFVVSDESIRYYNISSIYRKWYSEYDNSLGEENDNTISEVSFAVATCFTARTNSNGSVSYSSNGTEVIYITDKYVSYIRYTNDQVYNNYDSFFVAFSTDRQIDRLMEADIEFIHYSYHKTTDLTNNSGTSSFDNISYEYGDNITENLTLYSTESEEIQVGVLWWQTKYSWDQIESVEDFKNDDRKDLTQTTINNLADKDWVLNFWHAEYKTYSDMVGLVEMARHEEGTKVEDVTILRLKFETNGTTYNLGAIDNKQTGSDIPGGTDVSWLDQLKSWIRTILLVLLLILIMSVLGPFLPMIISAIIWIVKTVLKIVWWVISLPFKLFSKNKKRY